MVTTVTKRACPRAISAEVAGLQWLAAAQAGGGTRVARLAGAGEEWLSTARVEPRGASRQAARRFGYSLARTHAAGAESFGCAPPGLHGHGVMGEASLILHEPHPEPGTWGAFYARDRVLPYLPAARDNGAIDAAGTRIITACAERVADGHWDAPQPELVTGEVARIHGDLWAGNVLFTAADPQELGAVERGTSHEESEVEAILIDPAAHGGHAESDLAQLGVFTMPYRKEIIAGYEEVSPLASGWQERQGLHQLHILIVHAALFGGSYGPATVAAAQPYVS